MPPGVGFGLNSRAGLFNGLVGVMAPDGATYAERVKHRPLTVGGQTWQTEFGVGRKLTGSNGVYTPTYRAWADWELTTGPHSYAALVMLSSYSGTSGFAGNSNGANGYFVGQRYGDGTVYGAIGGGTISGSAGALRLNRPHVVAVTYDGAGTGRLWLDGAYVGQATSLTGTTWGDYCAPFLGSIIGLFGTLVGTAFWGALWGRELKRQELAEMAARPWSFWHADEGWAPEYVSASQPTFQASWAANSNVVLNSAVLA